MYPVIVPGAQHGQEGRPHVGVHAVLQAQPRRGQGIGGALHECRRAIGTRDEPAGGNGVATSNRPPPGERLPQAMGYPFDQRAIWSYRFIHGAQTSRLEARTTTPSAMAAGSACVNRIDVLAVAPPNTPATPTQPRKKIFSSRRSAHNAHRSPAAKKPL